MLDEYPWPSDEDLCMASADQLLRSAIAALERRMQRAVMIMGKHGSIWRFQMYMNCRADLTWHLVEEARMR